MLCIFMAPWNFIVLIEIISHLFMWHLQKTQKVLRTSNQISCSVVSDSLRPHELQHAKPPCPSPTPGVHWDSRPSSQWCHPAISSSVIPFSSCLQSRPASESFLMSQLFAWGGQSTGFSFSIIPSKEIPQTVPFWTERDKESSEEGMELPKLYWQEAGWENYSVANCATFLEKRRLRA